MPRSANKESVTKQVVVSNVALNALKGYCELFGLRYGDVATEAILYWFETKGKVLMNVAQERFNGKPNLAALVSAALEAAPAPSPEVENPAKPGLPV